jgi:hypothetical protein
MVQSTTQPVGEQTATLYHATPRRNLTSIICRGLLTAMSQGALAGVWLCEEGRQHWACMHAVRRHGGRIEDVIVVKVAVPRDWLRRHGNHNGLWRCTQDVAPQRFRGCRGFRELSASPVKGNVKVVRR